MVYHTIKVTKAGDVLKVKESLHLKSNPLKKGTPRQKKHNASSHSKQLLNDRLSFDNRVDKITSNYSNGDYFVTLTYAVPHLPSSIEDAKNVMDNFIRSLRRWKSDLCYEMNLESGSGTQRFHHHMIIKNYPGVEEVIRNKWAKYGHVHIRKIVDDGNSKNIYALAVYFSKSDENIKKIYKSSRGKKLPTVEFSNGAVQINDEYRCIRNAPFSSSKGGIRETVYIKNSDTSDYVRLMSHSDRTMI